MEQVTRWSSLPERSKRLLLNRFRVIVAYLEEHPNQELSWNAVNKYMPHIYRFMIESYNRNCSVKGFLDWSDDGIILHSVEGGLV